MAGVAVHAPRPFCAPPRRFRNCTTLNLHRLRPTHAKTSRWLRTPVVPHGEAPEGQCLFGTRCGSPCLRTECQLQERPGVVSQLHPPPRPAPSRPADWPVNTHSLLCLHCDVPTKDMHLLSCIAKGLPPRRLSAPKLQLPVCGLADPSTGAICLGGAVARTGSPLRPPSRLPLCHSGPIWSGALGSPGEAISPWGRPHSVPGTEEGPLCPPFTP
ncbi:uncharacterized protein LOC133056215 isoform X2 [Dama dama]|uniref:uncharacterized protein LOC133056215 isoform X2 n=1 Tax=Dama dama TaxID=30532 RepID=UPI002A36B480|nr:uncharacterized protein LOC133056215 isoform X2 [Dama dama]